MCASLPTSKMPSTCFCTFAFLLLFLLIPDYGIHGYEVGLCSEIGLTINVYSTSNNNKLVYMYMADLTLSPEDPYNTNISVTRQFAWSSDPSLYYQNVSSWPGCTSVDDDCSFIYPDGMIWQSYNVMMEDELVGFGLLTWYRIDQGTFFGVYDTFDPKQPPCLPDVGGNANFSGQYTYCCKKYTYFTIPDNDPNQCTELSGVTTFYDINNNTFSIFETNYDTTPQGINFTITGLMISGDRTFETEPNYFGGCGASASQPTCSMMLGMPTGDFQVDMYFYSYYASDKFWAAHIIMNKLIRRNGILMQNQSQPFTSENPCTPELSPPNSYLYYGEPTAKSVLCCTKYQQTTTDSTSVILAKQKLQKIVDDAKMKKSVKERMPKLIKQKMMPPPKQQPQKQLKKKEDWKN